METQDLLNLVIDNPTEIQTELTPIPEGRYPSLIYDCSLFNGVSKKTGEPYHCINVGLRIEDPEVAETVGRDNPSIFYSIFLKILPSGKLSPDNIALGQFMELTGSRDESPKSIQEILDNAIGQEIGCQIVEDTYFEDKYRTKVSKLFPVEELEEAEGNSDD